MNENETNNLELAKVLKQLDEEIDKTTENIVKELEKENNTGQNYINKEKLKANIQNHISKKFKLIIYFIWFIGYGSALIGGIYLLYNNTIFQGLLISFILAIFTWLSTLLFEAIAEIIQLLEDIKNK